MKKAIVLLFIIVVPFIGKSQSYKFCSYKNSSKYLLKFNQDDKQTATFQLYDSNDNLVKSTYGNWELRDEGVYGPVTYIIYKFGGANSSLPDMKFLFIRDGNGKPQEIRDSRDRTWSRCN
jgi:hypothetical protein